jgi:hypothetical protein
MSVMQLVLRFIKKCHWDDNQQEESGGLEILVAML